MGEIMSEGPSSVKPLLVCYKRVHFQLQTCVVRARPFRIGVAMHRERALSTITRLCRAELSGKLGSNKPFCAGAGCHPRIGHSRTTLPASIACPLSEEVTRGQISGVTRQPSHLPNDLAVFRSQRQHIRPDAQGGNIVPKPPIRRLSSGSVIESRWAEKSSLSEYQKWAG